MKKAVAYIDKQAILALLKVPFNAEIVNINYPTRADKIKIILEGEDLPVEKVHHKSKRLPEVSYTVLPHWHVAKIVPKTKELEDEGQNNN